jgi:RNA polymerase sigma factor (sigma-70 family)
VSFEEFYKNNFGRIYKLFYYKGVNPSGIEDLVHDTFLRFYRKYNDKDLSIEESEKILFGIARNVYKEWVRKMIKLKQVDLIENYEYEISSESESEDYDALESFSKSKKDFKLIKSAMKNLNPKIKKVLEMRFLEGKTRKITAEILGIKESDVHTYQKRGIKYIKKILAEGKSVPPKS